MSTFKIVLTSIFAVSLLFGILFFAMSKGKSAGQSANIVVWGTIGAEAFDLAYKASSISQNKLITVRYVKKDVADFDTQFTEALAEGTGPDMVLLRDDAFYKHRNKLFPIPYKNYSERTFRDTFIDAGNVFLSTDGVVALPFMIDPLVMYWNRDLFSSNGVVSPPKYWEQIYDVINKITRKDSSANVSQSALSFGEWRNVANAKEILTTLFFQAGTPITQRSSTMVTSVLNSRFDYPVQPSQSALSFYTQFSNPTSPSYTWNRSLPSSLNFFLAGDSATYFGFASEIFSIQQKNSNLNFDVASVPQVKDSQKKSVFGHLYGLALVKQSKQIASGYIVATGLVEPGSIKAIESATNLPPVRRDLLASRPTDAFRSVFYDSALISKTWIDPDPTRSSAIFRDMIESVTSGRARVSEALNTADMELSGLFR